MVPPATKRGRKLRWFAAALLLLLAGVSAPGQTPGVSDPVVGLLLEGRIEAIRAGAEGGMWEGTASGELARALVLEDGFAAATIYDALVEREDASPEVKAVAWFRIYGYSRLTGDGGRAEQALRELLRRPSLAQRLFHGTVPDPDELHARLEAEQEPEGGYTLQIGTFSERGNADRMAAAQERDGVSARVLSRRRGRGTVYVVYAGSFSTREAAEAFGSRRYGTSGRDFLVVEQE